MRKGFPTVMKAYEVNFCAKLAKGIARHFGSNCEVVVHDLYPENAEHSIVAIENGHVTGRRLGDGPSHVVWEALKGDPRKLEDRLAYLTRTEDGKILKSSTIFIRDEDEAQLEKLPYMLLVGDKEIEDGAVSVRKRGEGDIGSKSVDEFIASALADIASKKIW